MTPLYLILAGLLLLWALLHLKTSRPDGVLVRDLHPYRKLMAYIMPTRGGSAVYFDSYVHADPLLDYLRDASRRFEVDVTHCLVAAGLITLAENPTLNRFSVGRRLYQRTERAISFSMKRKQLDRGAKLATVKVALRDGETFRELCERINQSIDDERSGRPTSADREYALLDRVPRPLLRGAVGALQTLDYFNLLPASFIRSDGMYTSIFCANLGSLGMDPGFHHLYEWGNCPVFLMAGRIDEKPAVVDGRVVARKLLHLRWTYDERIDDGLNARHGIASVERALENPREYFGCLEADGSDARPLDTGAPGS